VVVKMVKRDVLIIKPGYSEILWKQTQSRHASLGDVLRTTPILHLFKNDRITWVADQRVFPILDSNPYIDRLLILDWITGKQLERESYDVCINLEPIEGVCDLTEMINAQKKYGYRPEFINGLMEVGVYPGSEVIRKGWDKKNNKKSVQRILFEMLESEWDGEEYILGYNPKNPEKYDIGLNPIAGNKWPTKSWSLGNWNNLEELLKEEGYSISRQDNQGKSVLTNLHKYFEWVNSCKSIVSNDSLGMHLGIALRKKVLGLFGPTAPNEVEFYGRGKALSLNTQLECMPCYEPKCNYHQDKYCLTAISVEQVFEEARSLLKE
jgi:heptosyltransferase II